MVIEFELESSDFNTPSIKIMTATRQEAIKLGQLFERIIQSGSSATMHDEEEWIRIPIQQPESKPKQKLPVEEVIAKF